MPRLINALYILIIITSCSKTSQEIEIDIDNPDETANVVMVYVHPTASDTAYFGFTGTNIKVEWGDGSIDSFPSLSIRPGEFLQNVTHKYEGGKNYIIKITSDELTYLSANRLSKINLKRATKLRKLWIPGGDIKELDLETVTLLNELICDFNEYLGKLDLSNNSALTNVKLSGCQITALNFENCSKLKYLECAGNLLKNLDLSGNPELEILNCDYNRLESINLSNNSKLRQLSVGYNLLDNIDISMNSKLYSLDIAENNLRSLDISMNHMLTGININSNNLPAIELNNIFGMLRHSSSNSNYIRIKNNPGTSGCNTSIAIQKNWVVHK